MNYKAHITRSEDYVNSMDGHGLFIRRITQ